MNPFSLLFLLFIIIPIIEIYLLIEVGGIIGAIPTILLIVLTAIVGAALIRFQGVATIFRARQEMSQGALPAMAMLEGVVLLIAGALLLTPGFFTDSIGFLALIPPLRRAVIAHLLGKAVLRATRGPRGPGGPQRRDEQQAPPRSGPRTLEGEYWRDDENK